MTRPPTLREILRSLDRGRLAVSWFDVTNDAHGIVQVSLRLDRVPAKAIDPKPPGDAGQKEPR